MACICSYSGKKIINFTDHQIHFCCNGMQCCITLKLSYTPVVVILCCSFYDIPITLLLMTCYFHSISTALILLTPRHNVHCHYYRLLTLVYIRDGTLLEMGQSSPLSSRPLRIHK